jgi:hypothetical protein
VISLTYVQVLYPPSLSLCLRNALAVLGVLWVAVVVVREARQLISFLQAYFLSPVLGVGRTNLAKYGSWAGG